MTDYAYDIAAKIVADYPALTVGVDSEALQDMLALAAKQGYLLGYGEGFAGAGQSFVGVL